MEKLKQLVSLEYGELSSVYLNTAYFGPSPLRSRQLVEKSLKHELDPSFAPYLEWYERPEKSRGQFASLLGTSPDNIFHTCSVSDVNNLIIHSLPEDSNQHIVVIDKDYPSNVLPYMRAAERRKNTKLTRLELGDEIIPHGEWLSKNLPIDTTVFCISWVTFDTGKKIDILDISKLLKQRGIRFIIDVTQGLGGLHLSKEELEAVDAISCASYKWMLGPYGHAFGYISNDFQQSLSHPNGNWITSKNSTIVNRLLNYTTETLPGARRFDRGQTANLLTIGALEGALDILKEAGLENIQQYNKTLSDFFLENFPKNKFELITPSEYRGNIVCLKGKNVDSLELENELKERDIDVSIREGNIRISFHLFNNLKQVEYLINTLSSH